MKSNCLIFALKKLYSEGGYLVIRKSRWGMFPHFLWCKDLKDAEIEHFIPINPKKRILPPLFFEGVIKKEDQNESE